MNILSSGSSRASCPQNVCSCGYAQVELSRRSLLGILSQLTRTQIEKMGPEEIIELFHKEGITFDGESLRATRGLPSFICKKTEVAVLKRLGRHLWQLNQLNLWPPSDPDDLPPTQIQNGEVLSWHEPDFLSGKPWEGIPENDNPDD